MDHDALEFEMQVQQNLLKDGVSVVDSEGVRGGSERGTKDAQRKDTHDNIQDMFDEEDDLMDEDVGEMEGVAAPHPQTSYGIGGTTPSHLPLPDTTQTKRLRKRKVMGRWQTENEYYPPDLSFLSSPQSTLFPRMRY